MPGVPVHGGIARLRTGFGEQLRLSPEGKRLAVRVMCKHRLAEVLLHRVIGLDWAQVHAEACRWEHVISEDAGRRIFELCGGPRFCPYGAPIPGLAELGVTDAPPPPVPRGIQQLSTAGRTGRRVVQLYRISERIPAKTAGRGAHSGCARTPGRPGGGAAAHRCGPGSN
ncbi:hypothetical protein Ntsu_59420 [Nocardia sp. IFM 10818]